jgi:nicotinamide phosphoribosyltransferase
MNIKRKEPTQAEQNGIMYQIRQKYGVVGDTDSYKLSHMPQYKKGGDMMISYFEARGGIRDKVLNFGAQMIAKEYFLQRLTHTQVDNMIAWAKEHMMGNMVDDLEIALRAVVNELGGRLPIRIRNAKEGLMIPIKNVILTIETTIPDKRYFSIVSYFETKLVRIWSPMTVGTTTYYVRQAIYKALQQSADNPDAEIDYKFHDFGSRGVGGMEVAAFAGASHLVFSKGTDTTVAVQALEFAYHIRMAGNSIPASEHSSTTTHGPEGEINLITQMFDAYAKPGAFFATVADSYDIINFIRNYTPLFKERLIESGATWVIRPDSGDPIKTPIMCVIELEKIFGTTVNSKGYKVLNNVRVIQGDGIVPEQVTEICDALMALGYSASNMAFGMGGGLLQKNNRDTHKFALKCCAARINGKWVDVYKDPSVYDEDWNKLDEASFKASKRGRLELMYNQTTDEYKTVRLEECEAMGTDWEIALETVLEDGYMVRDVTFEEVRKNAGII